MHGDTSDQLRLAWPVPSLCRRDKTDAKCCGLTGLLRGGIGGGKGGGVSCDDDGLSKAAEPASGKGTRAVMLVAAEPASGKGTRVVMLVAAEPASGKDTWVVMLVAAEPA